MDLIDYIADDIDHWLTLDENNDVACDTDDYIISCKSDIFVKFKKNYDDIYCICYRNKQKDILVFYKGKNNKILSVYFAGVNQLLYKYIPWIDMCDTDNLLFSYFMDGNFVSRLMDSVANVSQFYSEVKRIHLYIDDNYRNNVTKYYDSLPMFKVLSYILGNMDIIIEI